jgi:Protein of unknown function (DUF2530)
MPRPTRPVPPPLEGNDQLVTGVITVAWAVALGIVLLLRHDLPPSAHWWIWTCVAGVGLGLFGLLYVPILKRSRVRAARRRDELAQGRSGSSESISRSGITRPAGTDSS